MKVFARVEILKMDPPEGNRFILASENLFDLWGTRADDGRRITAEWGDPRPDGTYEPIFTATDDGKVIVDREEYEALVALARDYAPKEEESGTTPTDNDAESGRTAG